MPCYFSGNSKYENDVYRYNGDGQRMAQSVNGLLTRYLLDTQPGLSLVIAEATGGTVTHHLHSPRGIHASYTGGQRTDSLADGLGSVRARIDVTGDVLKAVSYSPYGLPNTDITGFAFTGEPRDLTGLQHHRARYYAPGLASWASLDPWEGTAHRAMSLNGYSWVEGNVVNATDASGQQTEVDVCGLPAEVSQHINFKNVSPCCGPDATEWLHREFINHGNYARSSGDLTSITPGILNRIAVYGLAVDFGNVDYRFLAQDSALRSNEKIPDSSSYSCDSGNVISVCGKCQNPTDYGNFILGVALAEAGTNRLLAELAGPIFNIASGDNSAAADNVGVVRGYDWAKLGLIYTVYQRENFCNTLRVAGNDWFDSLPNDCSGCACNSYPNLNNAYNTLTHWNVFVSSTTQTVTQRFGSPQDQLNSLIRGLLP